MANHKKIEPTPLMSPDALWRKLCEDRYKMAHCIKALKAHKIKVTRPTLNNWFMKRTSPPMDRWARIEPVLRKMVGP